MENVANNVESVVTEFEAKVAQARQDKLNSLKITRLTSEKAIDRTLRAEAINKMITLLQGVADAIGYDEEALERKIAVTRRSEYGRIPALINILSGIYSWPITAHGNPAEVPGLQEDILDYLASNSLDIDADLLLDIKEYKGYHSFVSDEAVIVDAVEPDIEEYDFAIVTIADIVGLPVVDNKLTLAKWNSIEAKAKAKAEAELADMQEALERHKALTA